MAGAANEDLFSSVVSDIKAYQGNDPLCPWLRGIRRMREFLSSQTLAEKLPRFLQKCAEAFESDRRYRNDIRYLGVWIQLMDHVDDPRGLLRRMEKNQIGVKHSAFYVAYSLYYEKQRKFEAAEKMYHIGAQKLAEPAVQLQKSYEQFLCRMELHKRRKSKRKEARVNMATKAAPTHQKEINPHKDANLAGLGEEVMDQKGGQTVERKETYQASSSIVGDPGGYDRLSMMELQPSLAEETGGEAGKCRTARRGKSILKTRHKRGESGGRGGDKGGGGEGSGDAIRPSSLATDDTVVVKFVGSAIVGKSEAEDACHHGLVDPTINMKEAMNAINSMFREPLELDPRPRRKQQQNIPRENPENSSGFGVFVDDDLRPSKSKQNPPEANPQNNNGFEIFVDDDPRPGREIGFEIFVDDNSDEGLGHRGEADPPLEDTGIGEAGSFVGGFKMQADDEDESECDDGDVEYPKTREDTVICSFVGSTVAGERVVENACHGGLVDPTINLKEAIDDINSMFGKPIDFVRAGRLKKKGDLPEQKQKQSHQDFSILIDEDVDQPAKKASLSCSDGSRRDSGLFEPTMFTKEAIDDINELFGRPLDF